MITIMSSGACYVPLPLKMEAFRSRLCLRAVDQYERLLRNHFDKSPKNHRQQEEMKFETSASNMTLTKKTINSINDVTETYSTVNAFRQWRKSQRAVENNVVLMNNAEINSSSCEENDTSSTINLNQFSMVLPDATMPEEDLSLKYLALNALDLTAPASDIVLKNRLKSWFQLSGHQNVFTPAGPGTIWKRCPGGTENIERLAYEELCQDSFINDYIPKYYREVEYKGDNFIELQDLLFGFNDPHVIDIKLGTRTFLESEVSKTNARTDLYEKMISVDANAPNDIEHKCRAITKLRYMLFREEQSSTRSHGFRIEAMKFPGKPPMKDLKKVKDHDEVTETLKLFFEQRKNICGKILFRLKEMKSRFEQSAYFQTHEIIGSSIFMIYDSEKVGVWLIDFAKTYKTPNGELMTHRKPWEPGNHEEGFLLGLDNLILTIEQVYATC